jgi:hypothetical protein
MIGPHDSPAALFAFRLVRCSIASLIGATGESQHLIPDAENIDAPVSATAPTVMAGLVPAIHDFAVKSKERRGWPAQGWP